jgi:hypothetical protein
MMVMELKCKKKYYWKETEVPLAQKRTKIAKSVRRISKLAAPALVT